MRRALHITLAVVLLAGAAALGHLAKERLNRTCVVLKNGAVIPVDRTWEAGEDLFYESQQSVSFISRKEIEEIRTEDLGYFARRAAEAAERGLDGTLDTLRRFMFQNFDRVGSIHFDPRMLYGAGGLLAAMLLLRFFLGPRSGRRREARHGASGRPPAIAPRAPAKPAGRGNVPDAEPPPAAKPKEARPAGDALPSRTDIVHFFLNIFRQQVEAPPDAPTEIIPLGDCAPGSMLLFELRVKHRSEWVKRRMTIGPLGETSGSKSKCYYVIFDRHIVVKVPPKPIRDFEEYIASIRKEHRIVERLSPKECIIPNVSVVLGLIPGIPLPAGASGGGAEADYIGWLRRSTQNQAALKIKDTFVFFMDLSRYYFLSRIVDELHDLSAPIRTELNSAAELLRHPEGFKERYGEAHEMLGFDLRKLYDLCENDIRQWLKNIGAEGELSAHRFEALFLEYLERRELSAAAAGLKGPVMACATDVFARQFHRYQATVDAFHACIHGYAESLTLDQNKPVMGGIIANLMELLAWLNGKNVAMRDLKPDNILVAGDPQNYPGFLRSAAGYSLGFIDVETALAIERGADRKLPQPLLGGTPYYATPGHLFANSVLDNTLDDAARVLHLQDWQAVLVMIYKVVTGELLFDHTARLFVDIKMRVIAAMRQGEPLEARMIEASRLFWRSAAHEFRRKIRAAEGALRHVSVDILPPVRAMLQRVLQMDMVAASATIRELVSSQSIIVNAACKEQLARAPSTQVSKVMEDVLAKSWALNTSTESTLASLKFLRQLTNLKARTERKAQWIAQLEGAAPKMSAFDLQLLMFNYILQGMYREAWGPLTEESQPAACRPDDEISLATTI
jgi:serine/threonine protein kinase